MLTTVFSCRGKARAQRDAIRAHILADLRAVEFDGAKLFQIDKERPQVAGPAKWGKAGTSVFDKVRGGRRLVAKAR